MTSTLDDLLNKVEAIFDCGAGLQSDLAKHLEVRQQRITEWIFQRSWQPSGATTLKIQQWAGKLTQQIALATPKLQSAYRKAYRDVCDKRRLVNGRNQNLCRHMVAKHPKYHESQ